MAKERPRPRQTLAKHLAKLLDKTGMSAPELAVKSGVDRKTINNQLNARYEPNLEIVRKEAAVFGLGEWQLIDPNFNPDKAQNAQLQELIDFYTKADEKGRENILRVAEMAATYK